MKSTWMRAAGAALAVACTPLGAADTAAKKEGVAQSPPPKLEYRSTLEDYRRYADVEVGSWRESNEDAAALGGHVGQLRGAPRKAAPMPHRHRGAKEGR